MHVGQGCKAMQIGQFKKYNLHMLQHYNPLHIGVRGYMIRAQGHG